LAPVPGSGSQAKEYRESLLKIILDTNVLIEAFRDDGFAGILEAKLRRSRLYLSSVVAMELRAGCRTRAQIRALLSYFAPFEKAERIVSPSHAGFVRSGYVLAELGERFGFEPAKRRSLSNDVLIAVSAVSVGAVLVTHNSADFRFIDQCLPLKWFQSLEDIPPSS
jgi:predicted nucleic acid-binding protein